MLGSVQINNYVSFVESRGFSYTQKQTATDKEEKGSTGLAATEGFSQEAAATLLEEEV